MNVAIIPAKGRSTRVPGKNIREFHGRPIIAYSIEAARNSGLFEQVVVSSDDHKVRKIARQCGAVAVDRDMRYTFDDIGTQEVVYDALLEMEVAGLGEPGYVCCIYATAPMLTASDLQRGYAAMMEAGRYAYIHGWYYWGRADWFGDLPLSYGEELPRPEARWIDINTEEDWQRAEQMYAALHKEAA